MGSGDKDKEKGGGLSEHKRYFFLVSDYENRFHF
jgi:hypothetical protein